MSSSAPSWPSGRGAVVSSTRWLPATSRVPSSSWWNGPRRSASRWDLAQDRLALARRIDDLRAAQGARLAPVLIIVDQAEELLTRTADRQRLWFLDLLRELLQQESRTRVIAALRSEFLTGFLTAGFADMFRHPMIVGALDRSELFQVIEGPASQAGLHFSPGVVNAMVDDTGGGDALPLLAYALQALYLRAGPGGTVTMPDYRQLGGVAGTLSRQADRVTTELQATDAHDLVLPTLLKFVTVDQAEPSRRRVRRSDLNESEHRIVEAFVEARLLTSDAAGHDATIEVAHEALFRQWAPLRQAVEARAEDLRRRSELERWAQDWVRAGRRDSYLLTGERLETARQWASGLGGATGGAALIDEFLASSVRVDTAALNRLSETVAANALATVDHDPELSLLLALAAIEECAHTAPAYRALLTALGNPSIRVLRQHTDTVQAVAWSPDGLRLVTGSDDRTVRVFDAEYGTELLALRGHEDPVWGVAWSPDGRRIASASQDGTARIWDALRGAELLVLRGHEGSVGVVGWAPDSQHIVTGARDGTARVWDALRGSQLLVLRGHEKAIWGAHWSPDGGRIATASDDGTARVWNAADGSDIAVLRGHEQAMWGVGWAPDSQHLVTASRDRTARVWDVVKPAELVMLRGHGDSVRSAFWSPDGRRIATGSHDHTARVWDAQDGTELITLRGHGAAVRGADWSPDGRRIATASHDRTARLWETQRGTELASLRGHSDWIGNLAWSPDGRRLATASEDCTVRVWDVERATELFVLRHAEPVLGVAWSPDGRRLATASHDRAARVWDVERYSELAVLTGHLDWIENLAWSPDGLRLATASGDRTARVWDAVGGTELAILRGHANRVSSVAGRRVATASGDGTARLWDPDRGVEPGELRGHTDGIPVVAWSPDGTHLATASRDTTARIWDAQQGVEVAVLRGHADLVGGVSWSPDGGRVATASRDRTARLWDARKGIELVMVCIHDDWLTQVAWSPDGTRIATASRDRTARVWEAVASFDELLAKARNRVSRRLSDEERRCRCRQWVRRQGSRRSPHRDSSARAAGLLRIDAQAFLSPESHTAVGSRSGPTCEQGAYRPRATALPRGTRANRYLCFFGSRPYCKAAETSSVP